MVLGDLGARVIKVEAPGIGDESRGWGPFVASEDGQTHSTYFMSCNRNKESIMLDLKAPSERAILEALVARADVVVENFRVGVLDRLGLSDRALRETNRRLIMLSITGFGHDGPEADRAGYDQIAQGEAGLMAMTGPEEGEPTRIGFAITDILAGANGAVGVLAALHRRHLTGRGEHVRVSLLTAAVSAHAYQGTRYLMAGEVPGLAGRFHPSICPYGMFHAVDGPVQLAVGNDSLWYRFATEFAINRPEWATNASRAEDCMAVVAEIDRIFAELTVDELVNRMKRIGVPFGRVRSIDEVYDWDQVRTQGLVLDVHHSALGQIQLPGPALRFDQALTQDHRPPPLLDEHGPAIRAWLSTDV